VVIARAAGRRFPGVLIQGDTLFGLLGGLEEEAPDSVACEQVRAWLDAYEGFMASASWDLPYQR